MAGSSDQPDDQAFSSLDRDGHLPHVTVFDELSELVEDSRELVLGVLDHPSPDDRALIIDQADPVHG